MSNVWTKEDVGIMAYVKPGRAYTHPTNLQELFHTDEELEFQGESPWLPRAMREHVSPSFGAMESMRARAKARLRACVLSRDIDEETLQCFSPHTRRPISSGRYGLSNVWLGTLRNDLERAIAEVAINPNLSEAIQASRKIVQLQDNWDTEGSPGYSESTWNRAVTFLQSHAIRYWKEHQKWLLTPRILPGPDGNIDLHWKTPQRELLISIPADPGNPAAFYGDDREDGTDNAIRGKGLDTSQHHDWILAWLMR